MDLRPELPQRAAVVRADAGQFLVVYPLPWDLQTSATFQNIPGIRLTATNPTNNAVVRSSLGRDLAQCRGAATCNAKHEPRAARPTANYESRLSQLDCASPGACGWAARRCAATSTSTNVLNGASILSMNAGYGNNWLVPYEIMGGRLVKFSGQIRILAASCYSISSTAIGLTSQWTGRGCSTDRRSPRGQRDGADPQLDRIGEAIDGFARVDRQSSVSSNVSR